MQNFHCAAASLKLSAPVEGMRFHISTKDWSLLDGTYFPKQSAKNLKMISHEELKQKQRHLREGFPEDIGLRIHRAISWVGRAEQEKRIDIMAVVGSIAPTQLESGEIPWTTGQKTDPWDHTEAAMGLTMLQGYGQTEGMTMSFLSQEDHLAALAGETWRLHSGILERT